MRGQVRGVRWTEQDGGRVMHNKMSYIAYSLMIVAYVLFIYDKKGFSVTMIIFAVIVIGVNYWLKKHQPEQSGDSLSEQGTDSQPNGQLVENEIVSDNVSVKNIAQELKTDGKPVINNTVRNRIKAKGDVSIETIDQKIK
ncbi:membrane protein [Candidatus Magnetobacterium bavaricum]|uniref:Membrane protein n=1 Tax=Candidatus Magnetobacterium bavaricum TaxID=29290 RepID=A0A0F3GSG2_9BACT|nr:membrane protein [Candidatus Magnetobacterium bavaricum]